MKEDISNPLGDSIIVIYDDIPYYKYQACLTIADHLIAPWPTIAKILRVIPKRIGDWGYDRVAHNRGLLMKVISFFRRER